MTVVKFPSQIQYRFNRALSEALGLSPMPQCLEAHFKMDRFPIIGGDVVVLSADVGDGNDERRLTSIELGIRELYHKHPNGYLKEL